MEVEVFKIQFSRLINALTWSNEFCSERGKRGGMGGKGKGPWQRNDMNFFWGSFIYNSYH
jgi:hypothetical protein